MVSALRQSAEAGELTRVTRPGEIDDRLDELMTQDWVVYTKHCLSRTDSVVDYLARYSHRIAITNTRLQTVNESGVTLRYKDYRDGEKSKVLHLAGEEFVRRLLLHILPKGFTRIRHYGFLAGRCRAGKLAQIRAALEQEDTGAEGDGNKGSDPQAIVEVRYHCPICKTGILHLVAEILPQYAWSEGRRRR